MSDERRYRGLWWIPAPEDDGSDVEKVGGVLTIDAAGRVHLEVMSALVDGHLQGDGSVRRRSARSFDEPRIIHGEAEGQAVTLLYCTRANGGMVHVAHVPTETQVFRAGAAVVGAWLEGDDDPVFVGMRVEMSHLTEWSGRSGLSHGITGPHPVDAGESSSATGHTVRVTLETVPSDRVELPGEDITAILLWSQSFGRGGTDNAWGRTHQIKERTFYEVQTPQPRGALEFQDAIRPVQNLLTLATQSPCAVGGRHLIAAEDAEGGRPRVELFFHGEDVEIKASREWHHLLFTLDDLGVLPRDVGQAAEGNVPADGGVLPVVIVGVQPSWQRCASGLFGPVVPGESPFGGHGPVEPFDLAVGLRPVGACVLRRDSELGAGALPQR